MMAAGAPDHSKGGPQYSFPDRQKSPNAGCALRLSCFWIPQVGYGIRSLGDHILRCRAVRF